MPKNSAPPEDRGTPRTFPLLVSTTRLSSAGRPLAAQHKSHPRIAASTNGKAFLRRDLRALPDLTRGVLLIIDSIERLAFLPFSKIMLKLFSLMVSFHFSK